MIDLEAMAKNSAARTHHRESDWRMALDEMVHEPHLNQMSDGEIQDLVDALASPSQARWLVGLFRDLGDQRGLTGKDGGGPFDALAVAVNQSGAPLAAWLHSLQLVFQRAAVENKKRDLLTLLEYVTCCVKSPTAKSGAFDLVAVVRENLDQHGYQG